MSKNENPYKNISTTHNIFFDYLTCKKVNELLKRADRYYTKIPRISILEYDIQQTLPPTIQVQTAVTLDNENQCNIYISFQEGEYKIGHITLHLTKDNSRIRKSTFKRNKTITNTIGRIHVRNNRGNRSRSHVIQVTNSTDRFKFELRGIPSVVENKLKQCANAAIGVIEEYFNPESSLFLGNVRTKPGKHRYFAKIRTNLQTSSTPLRGTRKANKTEREHCDFVTNT